MNTKQEKREKRLLIAFYQQLKNLMADNSHLTFDELDKWYDENKLNP